MGMKFSALIYSKFELEDFIMDKNKEIIASEVIQRLSQLEEKHCALLERVKNLEAEKIQSSELTAMLRELITRS